MYKVCVKLLLDILNELFLLVELLTNSAKGLLRNKYGFIMYLVARQMGDKTISCVEFRVNVFFYFYFADALK